MFNQLTHYSNMTQHNLDRAVTSAMQAKHARDRYYAVYEQKYFQCKTDAERMQLHELSVIHLQNAMSVIDIDHATESLKNYDPLGH